MHALCVWCGSPSCTCLDTDEEYLQAEAEMHKPICERIGARVRQRREELRFSLNDLAERTELSKTGLWQVETGRSEPSAGTVVRLCHALRVTADWLLGVGEEL